MLKKLGALCLVAVFFMQMVILPLDYVQATAGVG